MSNKKKYTITTKEFIEWLISDEEDVHEYGMRLFKQLRDTGRATFSGRALFREVESLPGHLFRDQMTESDVFLGIEFGDISTRDIKLIPSGSI